MIDTPTPAYVYSDTAFHEMVRSASKFFSKIPAMSLPDLPEFTGAGVYALYYKGSKSDLYSPLSLYNLPDPVLPIYVGKAVPRGWRQGRTDYQENGSYLMQRLKEHYRSLEQASNLDSQEFVCRFMVLQNESAPMIGILEAALIQEFQPLWNIHLDGFGNHDPGNGRYGQSRSSWDTLHPGRTWAQKCAENSDTQDTLYKKIKHIVECQTLGLPMPGR